MKRQKFLIKILIVASFSLVSSMAFASDAIFDTFEETFGHDKIPNAFEDTFGHKKIPNAFESAFSGKEKQPTAKPQKAQPEKTTPET